MGAPRPVELISVLDRRRTARPLWVVRPQARRLSMAASGRSTLSRRRFDAWASSNVPGVRRVISSSRPPPCSGDPVNCRSGGSTECPSPPGDRVLTGSASPSPPGTTKWRGASSFPATSRVAGTGRDGSRRAPSLGHGRLELGDRRDSADFVEEMWSGRRGSNPRHSAWEADTLPTELLPLGRPRSLAPALHRFNVTDRGYVPQRCLPADDAYRVTAFATEPTPDGSILRYPFLWGISTIPAGR
jgi:hypothetical protein